MESNELNVETLSGLIRAAHLEKSIICLHSSLKSFGLIKGGAEALIQAFLNLDCTVVVPTFTYECDVPPPHGRNIIQNGFGDFELPDFDKALVYNQNSPMINRQMGAIPAAVLNYNGHFRGIHPLNSFTAIGPKAKEIIEKQDYLNVYGPLKYIYHQPVAYIVLAGVDLTKATPIHYAEEKAGRRLFRRWAKIAEDKVAEVEVGSCSEGFNQFEPFVKPIEERITIGQSQCRIYPFTRFIDIVSDAISNNPQITHCDNERCNRCNDAVKGGPIFP